MAASRDVTHLFAELSLLDELGSLLGKSARLKYTCLSVSKKYLALGSNSGGAYIFNRDTLKYLQVVFSGTEASLVVGVSLSPSDQHVAIALSTGHVAVYELNIDKRAKPERVRHTQEHVGHSVTAFAWDDLSSRVFVGDNAGNISIISVPTNKSKNLFNFPSELIAHVETAMYQMAWWKDKLLVSTITHTHLFDTNKKNFSTIGTKSRDGEYGSCFYVEPSSKCTVIYCARPGSRMWEVDFEGKVLNTHQLKQLLTVPPIPVIQLGSEHFELVTTPHTGQSISFYKMFHISQFIITWSSKGVYLFDPVNVKVMIWTQSFKGIKDMSIYNNDVYLFLENSCVHRMTLLPIYQLFTVLSSRGLWSLSSSILLAADQVGMRQAVVKRIKKDLLQNILAGLKLEGRNDTMEKVRASMEDVSEGSVDSVEAENDFMDSAEVKGHTYLPSGMVIVNDGVQVKRLWEKKDTRMTVQDKLESAGSMESTSSLTEKYINEKDLDLQNKVGHANTVKHNKSIDKRTNDSDAYEQISNVDLLNKSKMEGRNETSSCVSISENHGLDSDHDLDGEVNVYLTNQHLRVQMSADDTFDNSEENNEIKLKHNMLTEFNKLVQENGTIASSAQESNHETKFSPSDLAETHSFVKGNTPPSSRNVSVPRKYIQTAHTGTSLSPQQSLDGGCSSSTDLPLFDETFIAAATTSDNKDIKEANQSTAAGFCDHSEENTHSVFNQKMFIIDSDDDEDDSATSENISSSFPNDVVVCDNVFCPTDSAIYCSSGENGTDVSHFQDAVKTNGASLGSSSNDSRLEEDLQSPYSDMVDAVRSDRKFEIFQENSTQETSPLNAQSDGTINTMAALNNEGLNGYSSNDPGMHSPLQLLHTNNTNIAQPVKVSKKKKKKLYGNSRSVSMDVDPKKTNKAKTLRKMVSLGDEQTEPQFMYGVDLEMDSISIATVSSIEEEENVASPDSLSAAGDLEVREQTPVQMMSLELSLTPPDTGRPLSLKSSTSSNHEERKPEVIPPLIDRLAAAARGPVNSNDVLVSLHQDSPAGSPQSADHSLSVGSSKTSLSALKDGLSLKLKTQTKSLIKTFKEKNILTKSSSTPQFPTMSTQQSPKDGTSQHVQGTVEFTALDELNKAKDLAITAASVTDLYISACNIQQQLRSSAVINPVILRRILNRWAAELNLAVIRYHEELMKKTNEVQWKEQELQSSLSRNNQNPDGIDISPRRHEQQIGKGLTPGHGSGAFPEPINPSQENQHASGSPASVITSPITEAPHLPSSEPTAPMHKSLSPTYWASVTHSDDPFQLPKKHLDLVRTLTTMCFVCGESGDILSHLNFTEEDHYRTFVKGVLPPSLYSLFSPGCECLLSLFPGSHSSSTKPSHPQTSTNSLRTEFSAKNDHSQSSMDPGINAIVSNSEQGGVADIFQGNDSYFTALSDTSLPTSLPHEIESQNNSGNEQISTKCSCKYNLRTWSENEHFKHDTSLALFTRLFFFALDYEKVKQALDNNNKMLITWTSLVVSSKEIGSGDIVSSILAEKQINSAIDYLRSGILPRRSALLGHVYKLFELAPIKISEFCGEIWKSISPVDLVQLSSLCSKPASSYVLRYFKQAMIHTATVMKPEVFRHLCKHRDVRYLLLDALLPSQSTDLFNDGIKSLASQLKPVLPIDWLNILLSMIASEDERDKVVGLSWAKNCLGVCVKLLTEVDQWQKLLQLIVDFNDISLLKGKHGEDGYIPRSKQEWKFLLRCFHTKWSTQNSTPASQQNILEIEGESQEAQSSPQHHSDTKLPSSSLLVRDSNATDISTYTAHRNTLVDAVFPQTVMAERKHEDSRIRYQSFLSEPDHDDPDNSITWHSLGYLLLEHVGGAAAMDLLEEHLSDPVVVKNCLKAEFLKACFLDFSIKMEQSHVMHDILERLSVQMWKKKPDFVPPSVFHSITAEKKLRENGEWEDVAVQEVFNQVKALESRDIMSKHLGSQWGQEINISSICQCCHISLKSVMTLTIQGVVMFPCGHAFHKTCVSGSTCPVIH